MLEFSLSVKITAAQAARTLQILGVLLVLLV
jgi:hypothetical protein